MNNYFQTKSKKVEDLKYFPFSSFTKFQEAVADKKIVDIGVPMDYARKWAMQSDMVLPFSRNVKSLMLLISAITPVFYLIFAFVIGNYWLLLYSLVPLLVFFIGSPAAQKLFPTKFILITIFVLLWVFLGEFPNWIYWAPLLIQYYAINYLYTSSVELVRDFVQKNEMVLVDFWKWWDLIIVLDNGEEHSQKSLKKDGGVIHYEDIQEELEDYLKLKLDKEGR